MRVLIAVALLMCGAVAQRIEPQAAKQEKVWPTHKEISGDEWHAIGGQDKPKQEKAQSAVLCLSSSSDPNYKCPDVGGKASIQVSPFPQTLPFDLPAKEWDGPDKHAKNTCGEPEYLSDGTPQMVACGGELIWEENHHVSCKDVAPDWRERVLLDSADGKHHCYAFYLLEQKP